MFKKYYLLGIASCFLIPMVALVGATIFIFINPEIAAGYPNYERNYRLLNLAKNFLLLTTAVTAVLLWFLTCFFLLKSKERSYRWLPVAMLGPFGLILLMMLRDNAPAPRDWHQQFIRRMRPFVRIAYELSFF